MAQCASGAVLSHVSDVLRLVETDRLIARVIADQITLAAIDAQILEQMEVMALKM